MYRSSVVEHMLTCKTMDFNTPTLQKTNKSKHNVNGEVPRSSGGVYCPPSALPKLKFFWVSLVRMGATGLAMAGNGLRVEEPRILGEVSRGFKYERKEATIVETFCVFQPSVHTVRP